MNQTITVKITVSPEQIEQLKAVLAIRDPEHETWANWKDYARTVALIGFQEGLEERLRRLPKGTVAQ